jgi:hypothetical protein
MLFIEKLAQTMLVLNGAHDALLADGPSPQLELAAKAAIELMAPFVERRQDIAVGKSAPLSAAELEAQLQTAMELVIRALQATIIVLDRLRADDSWVRRLADVDGINKRCSTGSAKSFLENAITCLEAVSASRPGI